MLCPVSVVSVVLGPETQCIIHKMGVTLLDYIIRIRDVFWFGPAAPKCWDLIHPRQVPYHEPTSVIRWFMIGHLSWALWIAKHMSNAGVAPSWL